LNAVLRTDLLEDVADVNFDGALSDEESLPDLRVGEAKRKKLEYFFLSLS
jgi:hypothetical protein